MTLRHLLLLAVSGTIHSMYWFLRNMCETVTMFGGLLDARDANATSTGLTWVLPIAAINLAHGAHCLNGATQKVVRSCHHTRHFPYYRLLRPSALSVSRSG